jgi:murein DD-endopeptidase MepM/ murein hydrolase activator NlpD
VIWAGATFLFFLFVVSTSIAGEIKLIGNMIQGGLVVGWATPGAKIQFDGKPIPQADSGNFLIGFARNFKLSAKLEFFFKDGTSQDRLLSIERRNYNIQKINGLPKRKVTPNKKDLALIKNQSKLINKARSVYVKEPYFTAGFVIPVVGRVSGVFGSQRILNGKRRQPHFGLDIAAPEGSVVRAASDGIITFIHKSMFFNGKTIIINHGLGLCSIYIHMNSINVRPGMKVLKGQVVGTVGSTGRATGPHLHWGLKLNQTPLDPEQLFWE